jgi:hypothetical protein
MSVSLARRMGTQVRLWASIGLLAGASIPCAMAQQPIAAHYLEGSLHGYLSMRGEDGQILAVGDLIQVVRGTQVTAHTVFHFKDGSLDDETTVFNQQRTFQLVSDHHIQKGPFFQHPLDMTVDVRKGTVTVRDPSKSGDAGTTDHMQLPADLCSGSMIVTIAKNLAPNTQETDVSLVVAAPKPRLVKLAFSAVGEDGFTLAGFERKARHYEVKFKLGGATGALASVVGKQPPNLEVWVEPGESPAFVKEMGPIAQDGPTVSIQQTGPEGPAAKK